MLNDIKDRTVLSNGVGMPWLGFGVFQVRAGREVEEAVAAALEAGYRSIDTAAAYRNEDGVGSAVKKSGIARDEIFLTSKVWNADQGFESTLKAYEWSCKRLGVDRLDLYLVHWPVPAKFAETWKALVKLYNDGKVRAIGVSNFQIHHIERAVDAAGVMPMVNQVELNPTFSQVPLRDYCRKNGIQIEAYAPLIRGGLEEPVLDGLAAKYGKTNAQIVLRWHLQSGIVAIPKSVRRGRIFENAAVFDFELSGEDMSAIDGMNRDQRLFPDPDNFNF